jgi:hypothetical protein
MPASSVEAASSLAALACGTYGVGAAAVVLYGARANSSRAVRALYWCAVPLFLGFVGVVTILALGGLRV